MAPFTGHAITSVVSTRVHSHDACSILVEAGILAPMQWFFDDARKVKKEQDSDDDPGVPKKKKRKVVRDDEEEGSVRLSHDGHIQISHFSIDLHFPNMKDSFSHKRQDILDDVDFDNVDSIPVQLDTTGASQDDGYAFKIIQRKEGSPILDVHTAGVSTEVFDAIRDHSGFHNPGGIILGIMRPRKRRAPGNPDKNATTLSICSLRLSKGEKYTVYRLDASIYWKSGWIGSVRSSLSSAYHHVPGDYRHLVGAFPDEALAATNVRKWSPQVFYDSVYTPPKDIDVSSLHDNLLDSQLFPFQKRAVSWMLHREGVEYRDGQIKYLPEESRRGISFYQRCKDVAGQICYVNHLQGIISRQRPADDGQQLRGGLLAEEMGLGKTVEVVALLNLHRRPTSDPSTVYDQEHDTDLRTSRATVIITPSSILEQWKSELAQHAPATRVYHYEGVESKSEKKKSKDKGFADLTTNYDVVLITYQTLRREIHYAEDPPERNMRHSRKFERKRSPLVDIQWWRVCLDEAQMVESGVSAAARVARSLPRVNSWAVTGTPLRKDVQDLHGLLVFLGVQPFNEQSQLWNHLVQSHPHLFGRIFGTIALRHTKAQIQEDLRLPPQKRVVITMPFSAVEQQQYSSRFDEMCNAVGVDREGGPKSDQWDPTSSETTEAMRNWLIRLRQTCLHPEVGIRNRKALGRGQGPLRTVAEVLEVMIDQNDTILRTEERNVLVSQLLRAHIIGNNGQDESRSQKALDIYLDAMNTSAKFVAGARENLEAAKKAEEAAGEVVIDTDDEDPDDEGAPLRSKLRNNLRTALQLQHTSVFFAATAYYQVKSNIALTEPDSEAFQKLEEKETALYEDAKTLRRELLRDSARKSEALMRKISDLQNSNGMTKMPKLKDLPGKGGIESRRLIEKSDDLFDVLRDLASTVVTWRAKMAEYLLKPLVDDDGGNEITGDEYEDSTKLQDELYAYFDAIKAVQADLNTFVTGQSAPLIDHEVKIGLKECKRCLDPEVPEEMKPQRHAPQLLIELYTERNKFRGRVEQVSSVRGLIQEARSLENTLQFYDGGARAAERTIIHQHLMALQSVFDDHMKAFGGLEKEIDLFRSTQNQRIDFYRQLQELSDDVQPHKEELDTELDEAALTLAVDKEARQTEVLRQLHTKQRYLYHLRNETGVQAGPKMCGICTGAIENGVLTVCGHQFCKKCLDMWWAPHRTCPECRRKLVLADFHNIVYKPQELRAQEENQSTSPTSGDPGALSSPSRNASSIYSDVDTKILNEIKSVDLPTSYGTKIDTLGRHLHWLRTNDPGAKSIIFSQYREFLDVLGTALNDFKIGHRRLGRAGTVESFRHDPSVDCLLIDAKTDSSGLTLVNATHVFICEPLIQTAVELQAIARVHRIGQTRPTTVWMYLISDSVEEAIYEISVARRLAHVQSRQAGHSGKQKSRSTTPAPLQEVALDAANTEEMQAAPISKLLHGGGNSGEMVEADDLWNCLFGKVQERVPQASAQAQREVDRHLRAEAADGRRNDVQ